MDPRRQSHQDSTSSYQSVATASNGNSLVRLLIILLIILSAFGIIFFGVKAVSAVSANSSVKSKQFQAVFLTNGQVYFGNLTAINNGYVKLTDIFYLQVSNSGSQTTVQPSSSSSSQQVSLAKLGNELHGPEDAMFINRSQVLFWENLKDSGKVVKAIKSYQSTNKPK